MTTKPQAPQVRAELRDWWFDSEHNCWRGDIYADRNDTYREGTPYFIGARQVKEVNEFVYYFIVEAKGGDKFVMWKDKELKRST